jgi:hypothetical protein
LSHFETRNLTPFAYESLFLADEEGRPLFVPVVKATFDIGKSGRLSLADEQVPVDVGGQFWGDPETSSYKYEPECAFIKPATDVVLIGSAHSQRAGDSEVTVALRVGPVEKAVRAVGDRQWFKVLGAFSMSHPKPFERIPLIYERAFGGWDRTDADPEKHDFEPRNPVGIGFRGRNGSFREGMQLPNLEDPRHPVRDIGDRPPPAGLGFTSPSWQPRAAFAGTYDESWTKQRMPLLPKDFDRRFFNAASPGLIVPGYLRGDEPVDVVNALPSGRISFRLPGIPPPKCRVHFQSGSKQTMTTRLDTVIVNTEENLLIQIWRACLVLRNGPQDIIAVKVNVGEWRLFPERS